MHGTNMKIILCVNYHEFLTFTADGDTPPGLSYGLFTAKGGGGRGRTGVILQRTGVWTRST